MRIKQFEDNEVLQPLPKETEKTVKVFLDEHGKEVVQWFNYMQNTEAHPLNAVIPYLHCRQIGIEANIILDMQNTSKPSLIINPDFVVFHKKHIKRGYQLSDSFLHKNKEHVKRLFKTERSEKILLKYSEYTNENAPLTVGSEEYEGSYAILLQEMVDISKGKLITRFEEIFEEEIEPDIFEGEVD